MPFTLSSVPYHCFCCFLCLELLSPCLLNCFLTLRKQVTQCLKNLPARAGDARDEGSILGSVRSPGGGNDNPLQYLTWRVPLTEKPGGLQSMESQRVGHNLLTEHMPC